MDATGGGVGELPYQGAFAVISTSDSDLLGYCCRGTSGSRVDDSLSFCTLIWEGVFLQARAGHRGRMSRWYAKVCAYGTCGTDAYVGPLLLAACHV